MTRVPVITFRPGDGTVEINSELFRRAETALVEAQQREAALAKEAPAEKRAPSTRRVIGVLGGKAAGFFA